MTRFVLASSSPARLGILRGAGITPEVIVSEVDEPAVVQAQSVERPLGPAETATVLAAAKAEAVAARLTGESALVLGCDSVLELDGVAYGRPGTAEIARSRWQGMRGQRGLLHTGHHLIDCGRERSVSHTATTALWFAEVTDAEIDAYIATGEPLEVAGAATIDGFGGPFIERIEGDHHNVIGLSLPLLRHLLADLGISITDLWDVNRLSGSVGGGS